MEPVILTSSQILDRVEGTLTFESEAGLYFSTQAAVEQPGTMSHEGNLLRLVKKLNRDGRVSPLFTTSC